MKRRTILTGLAAVPVAAIPVAVAATPEERIKNALAELTAAMQAHHPHARTTEVYSPQDRCVVVVLT